MTPESRTELQNLLSALCDGEITDVETARLEELLNGGADCRRMYLEYMEVHASLLFDPRRCAQPAPADKAKGPTREPAAPAGMLHWGRANISQALLVLGTLAASVLVQVLWLHPTPPERSPQQVAAPADDVRFAGKKPTYVATLVRAVDCVWDAPREPGGNGARLAPGTIRLPKGVASIRFDGGAELIVEGPAELNLESATAISVASGRVVLRAAESDVPFDVRTPSSTLVDIATDFGVSVSAEAEEVHVFEGELQRLSKKSSRDGGAPESLKAGEARRYESQTDRPEKPEIDAKQFVRHVVDPAVPAANAAAGLLAYEGFGYEKPFVLQNGKATGGFGWSSPWRASSVRPGPKTEHNRFSLNVKESLTRSDAAAVSVGGSFDYAGFARSFRKLSKPVELNTDSAYYLSFLFCRYGSAADVGDSLAMILWTDDDYQQQNFLDFRKRMYIGVKGSNQLATHLQRMNMSRSMPMTKGTTYLLVAKIAAGRSRPAQVFVRVVGPDETIEAEETGSWSLQSPPFRSELAFEWIELNMNGKNRQVIDEIRVGTTWASVTAPWLAAKH